MDKYDMIEHVLEGCQCEGKRCTKCKVSRCVGLFHKHKIGAGGLHAACRACSSASNKAHYQKNRERIMAKHAAWRDSRPDYHKQYYQEHADTLNMQSRDYYREHAEEICTQKKTYYREHALEILELRKQYQETQGEHLKQYRRNRYQKLAEQFKEQKRIDYQERQREIRERRKLHRKTHPEIYTAIDKAHLSRRRTRKTQAGGSYTPQQWRDLKLQYDYTCLCCGRREPEIKLTADHVIPITRGGTSDISNIQPLCYSCNSKKYNKIIDYRIGKEHDNGE
jgi:5-methylcytosine-specific restriction endonuclease McrA